jgi:glycosyltransferase involved in cell wall biosynthesis
MPNVVLEAMALGTPVIATRAGGSIELERDEPTILWAEANNPESLAEKIVRFSQDRDAANTRALNATAMIKEHHDVHQATRSIESLLKKACTDQEITT